jgi:hypothetical protein
VEHVPAKRSSSRRAKGTIEVKPANVTKERYAAMLIHDVLPAIRANWPVPGATIQLQHDNATPHSVTTMPEIKEALVQDGFNMTFAAQPAQSPDMNILDLGYFRSIETLHFQNDCNTVQDLLDSVQSSFKSLHVDVLDNTFITLQLVLGKTLEFLGDNCFKPPHINKQKKIKNGHLLPSISCSQIVLAKCDAELVRRGLLFQV